MTDTSTRHPPTDSSEPPADREPPHFTRRQRAAFIILYAIGLFLFLEVAARGILASEVLSGTAALRSPAGWRMWWVKRHEPGVPIFYGFDEYHPTRGWASKPGVRDADTFGPGSVNTNSIGLRGVAEVQIEKEPGRARIAILGDSFTFGDEVRDDEAYPSVLSTLLPEAEVVNFGVHGYGHDQMLLLLREQVLEYRPDLVVLGFVRDDMERNMLSFRDFAKPRFSLEKGELNLHNVPVPSPDAVRRGYRWRSRLLDLLAIVRDNYFWRSGYTERRMKELTAALLDAITEESVGVGARVAFVYLPHSEELLDRTLDTEGHRFFTTYCGRRGAFCLDLLPRFRAAIDAGTGIRAPGHWHATGHRVAAENLSRWFRERELTGAQSPPTGSASGGDAGGD